MLGLCSGIDGIPKQHPLARGGHKLLHDSLARMAESTHRCGSSRDYSHEFHEAPLAFHVDCDASLAHLCRARLVQRQPLQRLPQNQRVRREELLELNADHSRGRLEESWLSEQVRPAQRRPTVP